MCCRLSRIDEHPEHLAFRCSGKGREKIRMIESQVIRKGQQADFAAPA